MIETINKLTKAIRLEAEIIDKAFSLLLQHVSTEDSAMKEIIDKIETAEELMKECNPDPLDDAEYPF